MRNKACFLAALCLLLPASGALFAIEERTLTFSGEEIWGMADHRSGLSRADMVRPVPVLLLSSARAFAPGHGLTADLVLSFDEGDPSRFRDAAGRYRVSAGPLLEAVDRRLARSGEGAAFFSGGSPAAAAASFQGRLPGGQAAGAALVVEPQSPSALFAANNSVRDFALEFWLHPLAMENGEQILQWIAMRPGQSALAGAGFQRIAVTSSRNRLDWSFSGFFSSPDRARSIDVAFSGVTPLVPRTWSHHLVRFDADTGMIEYLVNGRPEAIVYATSTGREGGEVYTPLIGEGGSFVLGGAFSGIMDEFRISGGLAQDAVPRRYPLAGGRIETRAIDLGAGQNRVLALEASGGSARGSSSVGEFRRGGDFRFADYSEMQFFVRASNNPFRWDSPWVPVTPGQRVPGYVVGRYVQIAVDFYPCARGEATPFLEELSVVFLRDEPPLPPSRLAAVPMDGAVRLSWRHSPNPHTQGYLVFFGTADDEFFGEGSSLGPSPISVGMRNEVVIEGLQNGSLYFFRVAAYSHRGAGHLLDESLTHHVGEFSNEARARPLRGR